MKNYIISLFFIVLTFNSFINLVELRELKFVQAIWRHGDRSPTKLPYPNDPYNVSYWPRGWSQLTELGVTQMEDLGKFFRERYIGKFISENYHPDEIYIQSSDSDRALNSAQAFIDGMYQLNLCSSSNSNDENGGNHKKQLPIPIHSTGKAKDDFLLKPTSTDCPEYDKHYDTNTSKKLEKIAEDYSELFAFLSNVTGFGDGMTVKQAGKISNVQKEIYHGLVQPEWINKIWPQYQNKTTIEILTEIDRTRRLSEFEEEKLHKLRGGFLLGDWVNRVKNVMENKQKNPSKMMLYSAHDGTLLSLLYSLKIADNNQVPYAGAIIMEIFQNDNGTFELEILYRRLNKVVLKTIPNCGIECPAEKFYDLYKNRSLFSLKEVLKVCFVKVEGFGFVGGGGESENVLSLAYSSSSSSACPSSRIVNFSLTIMMGATIALMLLASRKLFEG